jgi:opacity protein-like surface antigen
VNGLKKLLLILTLVSGMILTMGLAALADSLYFDGMLFGNTEEDSDYPFGKSDGDLRSYTIGGDYFFDQRFKIAGEFTFGTEKYSSDDDFNDFLIKGGLKILSDKKMRLDGIVGYYTRDYEGADRELKAFLIGADAVFNLDKKSYLQGSFGYSFSGEFDDDDATTMLLNAKYVYLFSKNIGGSIGYRYNKISIDNGFNTDVTHSGLTVGAVYKF